MILRDRNRHFRVVVHHDRSRWITWYTMEQETLGGFSEPKRGIELGQGIGGCVRGSQPRSPVIIPLVGRISSRAGKLRRLWKLGSDAMGGLCQTACKSDPGLECALGVDESSGGVLTGLPDVLILELLRAEIPQRGV